MNGDRIGGTGKRLAGTGDSEGGSMMPVQTRVGGLWCRLMHAEPMWPSHGQYECRTCGRRFQVAWEQPSTAGPRGVVWQPEVEARISLAAERY
jgi:hypothetical protein